MSCGDSGRGPEEDAAAIWARALELLGRDRRAVEAAWTEGRAMDLASVLELATADDEVRSEASSTTTWG
jgi:hypothetical protein